jgi:tubulin beta
MNMREVVQAQVGGCGNRIGLKFWEYISSEHKIDWNKPNQNPCENANIYFSETLDGKCIPRNVCVDLTDEVLANIKSSNISSMIKSDNIVYGHQESGGIWLRGHYTLGPGLCEMVMESIRKETEKCESLCGFQIMHSTGGGCGAGTGTLVASNLREEYPDKLIQSFSVFDKNRTSEMPLEPYNEVLTMNQLIEIFDGCFIFDNSAISKTFQNHSKLNHSFENINSIIAQALSNITSLYRTSSKLTMRKFLNNLSPFPRTHFFSTNLFPIYTPELRFYKKYHEEEMIFETFHNKKNISDESSSPSKILSAYNVIRKKICNEEYIKESLNRVEKYHKRSFKSWIPESLHYHNTDMLLKDVYESSALVYNSTSITKLFEDILLKFNSLYGKKAFLWYFTQEGMDKMEFTGASANLQDLIDEYYLNHNL